MRKSILSKQVHDTLSLKHPITQLQKPRESINIIILFLDKINIINLTFHTSDYLFFYTHQI